MKLIVGLGNPGEKYENTRHNLGFVTVDKFLKDLASVKNSNWSKEEKLKSEIARLSFPEHGKDEKLILSRPQTYMNNSGMAVKLIADYYHVEPEDIWVVYDELDLPLGSLKIRFGGAAGGHHGVESVIEHLGTDKFWRFRMGIGMHQPHAPRQMREEDGVAAAIARRRADDAADFVLGNFTKSDQGKVGELVKSTCNALKVGLEKGLQAAQNQFNSR